MCPLHNLSMVSAGRVSTRLTPRLSDSTKRSFTVTLPDPDSVEVRSREKGVVAAPRHP